MENLKNTFKNKLIIKPIIISFVVFVVAFFIGIYLNDVLFPYMSEDMTLNRIGFLPILKNNFLVCLLNIVLGIITFGIYGVISNIYNGVLLGITAGVATTKFGLRVALLRLIPHAIFEIPTIIISTAYGIMTVYLIIRLVKKEKVDFKKLINQYLLVFVIMIILIILAAVVEGTVSMNLQ